MGGAGLYGSVAGAGQFGGADPLGGGGFSYGMAGSAGGIGGGGIGGGGIGGGGIGGGGIGGFGSIGGPGTFSSGAPGNATFGSGGGSVGFSLGGASQFGGIGGGQATTFGASAAPGGASGDDPYANIAIDLNKIKAAPKPAKPFEKKSEEEKNNDALERKNSNIKSNLKTTTQDFEAAKKKEVSVSFGKSTTYEVAVSDDDDGSFTVANV